MNRIENEKQIVCKMIGLYCRHRLHQNTLPEEYQHLADFACRRRARIAPRIVTLQKNAPRFVRLCAG